MRPVHREQKRYEQTSDQLWNSAVLAAVAGARVIETFKDEFVCTWFKTFFTFSPFFFNLIHLCHLWNFHFLQSCWEMAGASSEPQHCWGLERVPRDFEGPTYILQNAQVDHQFVTLPVWISGSQEEISLGRNRKSNIKVCDGPNVSRNHLKLVR